MKAIQHTLPAKLHQQHVHVNPFTVFMNWCQQQEKSRLLWVGMILAAHGCFITPITLMTIMINGNPFVLWPFALASILICLITNLAALPLKVTIPVFITSLVIDLGVMVAAIGWSHML